MEKAKDLDDLIKRLADELQSFDKMLYDLDSLCYGGIMDEWTYEYDDYLELSDEDFAKVPEDELHGWQRDMAADLRETLCLPHCIEKPESFEAFRWMEDFTTQHSDNNKFYNYAVKALNNRKPFRGFRAALDWNGLTKDWYAFHDERMREYVSDHITKQ